MRISLFLIAFLLSVKVLAQWNIQYYEGYSNINKISFFDNSTGLLMGDNATILKSTDGGKVWRKIEIEGDWIFQDFQFLTADTLVALAHRYDTELISQIFSSFDTGETWQVNSVHPNLQLYSQWFFNLNIGIIAGYKGIYRTLDGGLKWEEVYSYEVNYNGFILPSSFSNLFFVNENIGFAIENNHEFRQVLIKTEDGGLTWKRLVNSPNHLSSIKFLDANEGFVGSRNLIYKTSDGGLTWGETTLDNGRTITDFDFISPEVGFAIGSDLGIILTFGSGNQHFSSISKTIDGGDSWNTISNFGFFYSLDFLSEEVGYISGGRNLIMKTENGNIENLPEDYPWILSIDETPEIDNIYPNPTTGDLVVEMAHPLALTDFQVMNLEGKNMNIHKQQLGRKIFFDLNQVPNGVYILRALNNKKEVVRVKLIKI